MNDINILLWRLNVCVRRISIALATLLGWLRPYLARSCVLRNRAAATGPPLLGCRRWAAAAEPPPPVGRRWAAAAGPSPRPRMCGACAGKRRNFDSIGAGVTGAPRPGPFQATDVRGVPGERRTIDSLGKTRTSSDEKTPHEPERTGRTDSNWERAHGVEHRPMARARPNASHVPGDGDGE